MPDFIIVLLDCSVRREETSLADVDKHLLSPSLLILIISVSLLFCLAVILKVWECHEPVFVEELVCRNSGISYRGTVVDCARDQMLLTH